MSGAVAASDHAIEVTGLSKKFRIATERRDSLKERFVRGSGRYDEFWALRDVGFTVGHGTTFGLIGHNGSGKSTLLKMLAGIYRPTSGSIATNGRISALLELGAGFHGELSGRENVYLNGAILGLTRKQIDAALDGIIHFSGLEEFIDSPVKIYSSGMYVRLGFSIAVTVEPEILIVDEIIAVGDEEFQRKCFDHLYELRRRGTTIVLVTHSLGIVADLCDDALWLDKGRLKSIGKARDVIDDYLEDVNKKEADARLAAGEEAPEDVDEGRTSRLGSGEIRVTSVELFDHAGAPTGFLTAGEACTIRMHYQAKADLPGVTFGLGFIHESGVNVAGPNTGYEQELPVKAGRGYVDFHLEDMILQPSTFLISVAAVHKGHTYDYRDRVFELRVRAHGAVTEPGLVRLPGTWKRGADDTVPTIARADAEAEPVKERSS